jgi:hypothetical protein
MEFSTPISTSGTALLLHTYSFNGSTWTETNIPTGVGTGEQFSKPMAALSSTRIAIGLPGAFIGTVNTSAFDLNTNSVTKLEPQYLLDNKVATTTGLQGYPTLWRSSEWGVSSATYTHFIDSTNAISSAKLQDIDNANTDVTGSTATGNNQIFSSSMTLPSSGHQIDTNITAIASTVTGNVIDAAVVLDGSGVTPANFAPSTPTLTAPASGATGVSTTPTFSFSDTDPDSDDIQFTINLFQSNCTTSVTTYAMSSGQTGWSPTFDGTAGSGLTYLSSTAGTSPYISFTPSSALSNSTTYCWSVSAIDPGGSNTTTTSSTQSFTTAAAGGTEQLNIGGGVNITGGTNVY